MKKSQRIELKKKIKKAAKAFYALAERRQELMDDNKKIFRELDDIKTSQEELELVIKESSRALAKQGTTVYPFSDESITVEVQSPKSTPRFDFLKARKHWPSDVLNQVLVIDSKAVLALVSDKEMSTKLAAKAQLETEHLTPRVLIKVKPF